MDYLPGAVLMAHSHEFAPVVPFDLNADTVTRLDFTEQNNLLRNQNVVDTRQFDAFVQNQLHQKKATVGVGGYLENRIIYRRSALFGQNHADRSIHLGVDIWAPAGTPVFTPLEARVHSFQDNNQFGDYGPTIILEHQFNHLRFYTLYGHLSRNSLHHLQTGKIFKKGEIVGYIGPYPENGDWPPHLHFQIITNLQGCRGDFPGVCRPAEKTSYARLCPDPNLILQSRHLTAF